VCNASFIINYFIFQSATNSESGKFTVIKKSKDTVLIEIDFDNNSEPAKNVLLKKWIPKLEQKSIEYANLKSGDRVCIYIKI
jgi:hypothetical protein